MQTPILLSNTFAVGTLFNAMVRRSCLRYPQIGRGSATINPLVLECNDGYLNDIQAMAVREEHVFSALITIQPALRAAASAPGAA